MQEQSVETRLNLQAKTQLRTKGRMKNMMKLLSVRMIRGARGKTGICGIAIAVAAIALVRAQAQDLRPVHFSGVVNDYSPSTVSGGPYEIRGDWSLDLVRGGTANFSADLNMETSDYGIAGTTQVDPANPEVSLELAFSAARQGAFAEAIERWERYLLDVPSSRHAARVRTMIDATRGLVTLIEEHAHVG